MPEPIFMQVGGGGTTIEFPEFYGALGEFLGLLRDFDSTIAERKAGNLIWRLTALERRPAPVVGVTPFLRKANNDTSERVERALIANVSALTERGERDRLLSDSAINRIERLAKLTPRIGPTSIYTSIKNVPLATTVTVATLRHVEELTAVKATSYGTVSGSLGSISVHKSHEFRVWDRHTNRSVRCIFNRKKEEQAKSLLGKDVVATGLIRSDRSGRPISMVVEDFDAFVEPTNLPTIDEMYGLVPDFTGGRSIKEFFEDYD